MMETDVKSVNVIGQVQKLMRVASYLVGINYQDLLAIPHQYGIYTFMSRYKLADRVGKNRNDK